MAAEEPAAPKVEAVAKTGRKLMRKDSVLGIAENAITRLARIAGVKTMSRPVILEVRAYIVSSLERIMKDAVIYCEHARRRTVQKDDILHALERAPWPRRKLYYTGEKQVDRCPVYQPPKRSKTAGRGTVAVAEIKFYQSKFGDCLHIAKLAFETVVREISQDFKTDLKFEGKAFLALQYAIEALVVDLFEGAQIAAIHAGRTAVLPKDVNIVQKLRYFDH
jgi:histone H3